MNRFFSLSLVFLMTSVSAYALEPDECFDLIAQAETGEVMELNPYDACDFNDEEVAWEVWAPYASEHNYKRALFELCERYPNHVYHDVYCEKSATLGYGPALALKAAKHIKKGDAEIGLRWATEALETKELSEEQTGSLLETVGMHYLKENNPKYQEYLEKAAKRRSSLANHVLAVQMYSTPDLSEEMKKRAFMHMWRAILLDCPYAQENLGLFHLARQGKIPLKTAQQLMKDKMMTCRSDAPQTAEITDERTLFGCQCKAVLTNEKRFREKPYVLLEVNGDTAILQDAGGQKYPVTANSNLPKQGKVDEVRKTAVILTYPNNRIVLNLYKEDKCVSFCNKYHITENLTPAQMQKRIMGGEDIVLKPYRLSFNETECETLAYYAKHLVDMSLPYVGKEECAAGAQADKDTILPLVQKTSAEVQLKVEEKPVVQDDMTDNTKKRLKSFGSEVLGI